MSTRSGLIPTYGDYDYLTSIDTETLDTALINAVYRKFGRAIRITVDPPNPFTDHSEPTGTGYLIFFHYEKPYSELQILHPGGNFQPEYQPIRFKRRYILGYIDAVYRR
jgi:hypothetical protein